MARIAGVDIPNEKNIGISLTYIYGIGRPTAAKILAKVGVDPLKRVKDLNENELENIVLEDNRIFKLQGNLVNLLMENKKVVSNDIYEEEAVNSEDVLIKDDYETLYREMVTKNELLEQRINMLEEELKIYKQKLESIDDIIHS